VLRRLLPATTGIAVLAAACGQEAIVVRPAELAEPAFFTQVVDFTADVGAGLSMSTDADGNPHLAYLAFEEEAAEGETPATAALGPVLPAVKHAHMVEGTWTRTSVAEELDGLTPKDEAAIWVDQEGTHHIAWTQGGDLFYTDDPEGGAEAEPQAVTTGPVEGISIAAGQDGTPSISFFQEGQVAVATPSGKQWAVEPVGAANPGALPTTAIRVAGRDPIVAYGDGGATIVARRSGNQWTPETADQAGGLGVFMALDADGNPHLAYYDESGAVKHAHDVGGGWEVGDVADAGGVPEAGSAAIVLDSQGIHHVAWQNADATLGYTNNEEGDFGEAQEVPRSDAGSLPVLGVNAEDEPFLGWVDTEDTEVQLALRTDDEPLLALPSPQPTAAGGPATAGPAPCQPQGTELTLTAPQGAVTAGWAEDCLAVDAGQAFSVEVVNQDAAPHNVGIYTAAPPSGENIFSSPISGVSPGSSETFDVEPIEETGDLYFQCDIHPTMTGTFVVAEAGGGGGGNGG
jgi:plastocyanin